MLLGFGLRRGGQTCSSVGLLSVWVWREITIDVALEECLFEIEEDWVG
jgi:hypothetical protein